MRDAFPFLSSTQPQCPQSLLDRARGLAVPRVALVNAGSANALSGIREAWEAGLADPVLIGDRDRITATAAEIGWDIRPFSLLHAPKDAAATEGARLARTGEVQSIMKGQIHTSAFLKALLPSAAGLRDKGTRCGHVFHLTVSGSDRALLLTDGALNVDPDVDTRKACLAHAVNLAKLLGVAHPKAGILSPTEDIVPTIPNTGEAAEITEWAKSALPGCSVQGPMALDLIWSRAAAQAKGFASDVSGDADILCVPNITSGNALFKLMVLGMGACAGGIVMGLRVPVLLTSRSQGAADRLASAALGVIVANGQKGAQA